MHSRQLAAIPYMPHAAETNVLSARVTMKISLGGHFVVYFLLLAAACAVEIFRIRGACAAQPNQ